MRSSDPSVYAHASAGASAAEPGTRDISVSPSPTSSPSQSALANRRAAHLGFDEADEDMDVEDSDSDLDDDADADDATAAAMHQPRRRATVAGVQRVPPLALAPASASDLARDIGALSATQMVALSSELVRRVATALPLLAEEARHHRHHAPHNGHNQSASSDAVVENPLDVLFGHIRASLLTPDFSGLLLSSPQHFPSVSSDCDPPFTLRRVDITSNPAAMTTTAATGLLARVSASMQRIAPLSLAELDWDNVGILLEAAQPKPDAKKVFLTIDLTSTTLNEALADPDVGVIVAYHPPIFSAWKSLSMGNLKQSLVLKCAAAGVSIYSPHTSLDSCADGINDWLASLVVDPATTTATTGGGGSTVVPIAPAAPEKAAGQDNVGTGRLVELATPRPLSDIVRALKTRLSLDHMRVARAPCHQQGGEEKLVSRIAICAGSGASVLRSASAADLYFTGEMDHHSILAAVEQGISCVLAEHTNTERGYLRAVLQRRLQEELGGGGDEEPVSVVVSESDKDPITIE
ncbi:hypothetical protein GGH95_003944 [Coemansia sp. RSA 1836]|nr:hypothetical protein GGH95_003944 [Coemansia sp. RSA 1836]